MSPKLFILTIGILSATEGVAFPTGFVDIKDIAPNIIVETRYSGHHNFVGRPIEGYHANKCILTKKAALALGRIQKKLLKEGLTLKVFDCYRPQRAVNDLIAWSQTDHEKMKDEFFPNLSKLAISDGRYISKRSSHSRGSTVDVTIAPYRATEFPAYALNSPLFPCNGPVQERFRENSLDMGTGFDCMDRKAETNYWKLPSEVKKNRQLLLRVMRQGGFKNYPKEWWHFTLKEEPYPKRFFDFPIH